MSLGWSAPGLAVLGAVITVLCATGRIPANGLVGIRTPATQRSEGAWMAGHRAAAQLLVPAAVIVGVLSVAVGLGWTVAGLPVEATGGAIFWGYVVVLVIPAVVAHRAARGGPFRGTETTRYHPWARPSLGFVARSPISSSRSPWWRQCDGASRSRSATWSGRSLRPAWRAQRAGGACLRRRAFCPPALPSVLDVACTVTLRAQDRGASVGRHGGARDAHPVLNDH